MAPTMMSLCVILSKERGGESRFFRGVLPLKGRKINGLSLAICFLANSNERFPLGRTLEGEKTPKTKGWIAWCLM